MLVKQGGCSLWLQACTWPIRQMRDRQSQSSIDLSIYLSIYLSIFFGPMFYIMNLKPITFLFFQMLSGFTHAIFFFKIHSKQRQFANYSSKNCDNTVLREYEECVESEMSVNIWIWLNEYWVRVRLLETNHVVSDLGSLELRVKCNWKIFRVVCHSFQLILTRRFLENENKECQENMGLYNW